MKKLITLFALLAIFCASQSAKAEIQYHDIEGGYKINYDSDMGLDLDADGKVDFIIKFKTFAKEKDVILAIMPESYNRFIGVNYYASNLEFGEEISKNSNWIGDYGMFFPIAELSNGIPKGSFAGKGSGFLGVKFLSQGSYKCGWIKIEVDYYLNSFTIYSYAFENNKDKEIKAGDMEFMSIEDSKANELSVFPNPSNGNINVKFEDSAFNTCSLKVLDASGKIVYNEQLTVNSDKLNLDFLSKGTYSLIFDRNGKLNYEKIIIE